MTNRQLSLPAFQVSDRTVSMLLVCMVFSVLVGFAVALNWIWSLLIPGMMIIAIVALAVLERPRRALWLPVIALIAYFSYPAVRLFLVLRMGVPSQIVSSWQELYVVGLFVLAFVLQKGKTTTFARASLDRLAILLLCVAAFEALVGREPILIVYGFRQTYLPVVLYLLLRQLPFAKKHVRAFVNTLMILAVLAAAIGIVSHLWLDRSQIIALYGLAYPEGSAYGADVGYIFGRQGAVRMGSVLMNPLYFGNAMALSALVAFSFALDSASRYSRWRWVFAFLLLSLACYLSLTRAAVMVEVIGLLVIGWLHLQHQRSIGMILARGLILGSTIAGLAVVVFLIVPSISADIVSIPMDGFIRMFSQEYWQSDRRLIQWARSLEGFQESPIWGYGLGMTGHVAARFRYAGVVNTSAPQVADGYYFKTLTEGGLIALSVFCAFLWVLLRTGWRLLSQDRRDQFWMAYHSAALAIFVAMIVASIYSNVWDYYLIGPLFWMLIAFMMTRQKKA